MPEPITTTASIFVRRAPEKVLERAMDFDAPSVVRKRGLLPGVRSVSGATGAWTNVGQKRQLVLTDGSRVEETLVDITPSSYAYRVADFTGPIRLLVREAKASFAVEPRRDGSMLTWTYEFKPKSALAAPIISFLVDTAYNAWMDAGLERLKDAIEAA
jgi:hypothetical protein